MGMFDKPQYLTGDNGFVHPGESFYIHNARPDGYVTVAGKERPQVKLRVSILADGDKETVYTSGAGIVNQISRLDDNDIKAMREGGLHVRLDEIPSSKGNPTRVLTPADQEPPNTVTEPQDF